MKLNALKMHGIIALAAIIAFGFAACKDPNGGDNTIHVDSVKLDKETLSLSVGYPEKLTVTVLPADAENKKVTWSSSNEEIATVDANGNVTGIADGEATITVRSEDGGKTATCAVTVASVAVASVSLNFTTINNLAIGATRTLEATVAPERASVKTVTWDSSNKGVATVSGSVDASGKNIGTVTGVAEGNATITVTTDDGEKTTTCAVTVIIPPDSLTITSQPTQTRYAVGAPFLNTSGLAITAVYGSTGRPITNMDDVEFSGFADAVTSAGEKTITATHRGVDVTFKITVFATVTFSLREGTWTRATNTEEGTGSAIAKPEDPTRTDYTFFGWSAQESSDTLFDFSTPVLVNTTLHAQWKAKPIITLNATDGTLAAGTEGTFRIDWNTALVQPANPTHTSRGFYGWSTTSGGLQAAGAAAFDFTALITQDTTLYAKWNPIVTFNASNGGTLETAATVQQTWNTAIARPTTDPTHTDRSFYGWSTTSGELQAAGAAAFDFAKLITEDTTIYAKWNPVITFNTSVGANGSENKILVQQPWNTGIESFEGNTLAYEWNTYVSGADFDGWYIQKTVWEEFSGPVTEDVTLHARWDFGNNTTLTDTYYVLPYLATKNTTADTPISMTMASSYYLGNTQAESSGWTQLLDVINRAGTFVALDLSSCTMYQTVFYGSRGVDGGTNRIVTIALPNTARTVEGFGYYSSFITRFTALKSFSGTGLTTIGESAFENFRSLTMTSLPAGITSIGKSAFRSCKNLALTSLSESLISIGDYAFSSVSGLTQITLPSTLATIGGFAFISTELTLVTCLAVTPPTGDNIFSIDSWSPNLRIEVPAGSVAAYKAAAGWSDYADRIFAITP